MKGSKKIIRKNYKYTVVLTYNIHIYTVYILAFVYKKEVQKRGTGVGKVGLLLSSHLEY